MLKRIIELYENADADKIEALAALDDRVDRKHAAIKLYLAKVTSTPAHARPRRCAARSCSAPASSSSRSATSSCATCWRMCRRSSTAGWNSPTEGWRELAAFHASVLANARLAFNVLVSRDPETARQLVREKDRLRDLEKETSQSHFVRLRDGTAKSVETSSIHLDTIRDLKQINSLLASMAYPVLEERGLLTGSRLKAG